ncbi:MAG TPA: hypothetical protein VGD67_23220 [Pseudonocardiaceae bacterium]
MRRLMGTAAALALVTGALTAGTATAADTQACRFIQTPLNYSAMNYGWAQGLEDCAGYVTNTWQIGPTSTGPWTTQPSYDLYYNDNYASNWVFEGDLCNGWHRLTATYGTQSITTNAVRGVGEPC